MYVEKLCRECRKGVLEEFNRGHVKMAPSEIDRYVISAVERWFNQRDKSLKVKADPGKVLRGPRLGEVHLRFTGSNKDVDFVFRIDVDSFVTRTQNAKGELQEACYLKNMNVEVNKKDFISRKVV